LSIYHRFADLLTSVASLSLKSKSKDAPIDKFERWAKFVRAREGGVPPETGVVLFRLLFPEEDVRRKYDLKETRLAAALCDVLGVSKHSNRGKALVQWGEWTDASEERPKTGCLGDEVKQVLSATYMVCARLFARVAGRLNSQRRIERDQACPSTA
jgi:DNA ligase-4